MIKLVLWAGELKRSFVGDRGAGLAEYALLLFVIAVAIAGVVGAFGGMIGGLFEDATNDLPTPPTT